jgi:hypothetical protein
MGTHLLSAALIAASALSSDASYRTQNFVVTARTPELARDVGDAAEAYRSRLALYWLARTAAMARALRCHCAGQP